MERPRSPSGAVPATERVLVEAERVVQIGSSPPEMVRRVAELNLRRPPKILVVDDAGDAGVAHAEEVSS